ncbi:MAG TPA: hypothetical protein VMS65_06890 [Polyangiaceae bacterium]|nr:hypothetical protein [Polyangiaceae bacterium]
MPTHKLWIEHTERAAWQSVQALREKLAEAERHAERMAPPVEGWRELFAVLDAARESHALTGATYADLIAAALERLTRAETERRALEARLAGEPPRPILEPEPLPRRRQGVRGVVANDDDELAAERPNRSERQFFLEIHERDRALAKERPRPDPELALGDIERRLADLPELDPAEIIDIAADLAALALHLQPAHDLDDD